MTRQGQPRFPRVKRTVELIETPEGDLIFMRAAAESVRIAQPSDVDRALLAALDGTHSLNELEATFGSKAVRETLDGMRAYSLLEDAADYRDLPPELLDRFDRQLRYFSDIGPEDSSPAKFQTRLRNARVSILGLGGLGGRVALELASLGIGELRIIDGDVVETSNLNRQIQFRERDIGLPKARVTAERLRELNSALTVYAREERLESEDELAEFIAGSDLVVDAADWPAHKIEQWCNAACFKAGIPYITMSHFPPRARVGPLYVPGRTGCFQCQVIKYRSEYPLFEVVREQRTGISSPAAAFGSVCGVVGGFAAGEVLHYLTGIAEPAALGVAIHYNLLKIYDVEPEPVVPQPGCPICGHLTHDPLRRSLDPSYEEDQE
jgi:bacteriocin biosynthesis cyclodehydratase domain-containing protein